MFVFSVTSSPELHWSSSYAQRQSRTDATFPIFHFFDSITRVSIERLACTMKMVVTRFVICIIITITMSVKGNVWAQTIDMSVDERKPSECGDLRQQLDTVTAVKEAACVEVCAMEDLLDGKMRERCGCEDHDVDSAPDMGEEDDAMRSALCSTALADMIQWHEDADLVEITNSSLTMTVTEDVVLYTLCHTACSPLCGVKHNVSDVSIYESELVVTDGMRTPVSSFFDGTSELWMSEEAVLVNVLGTADDNGTEVSVKMVVWSPVYDEASNAVRFDARPVNGLEDIIMDYEASLSPPSPGGDRRRRRLLQQTQGAEIDTSVYPNPNPMYPNSPTVTVTGATMTAVKPYVYEPCGGTCDSYASRRDVETSAPP